MEFDPDGRLWVLEMLTFLPDTSGRDSKEPLNRVSVLEDTDGDGKMDKKTVFADKLAMPRALKVLEHGVLVGEPPNLWLMKDTDGDLKADTKDVVVNTYGNPNGGIEHNANSLFWAMDNVMYSSEHVWDLRLQNGKLESLPALSRGQWQVSQDDAGRIYRNVNDSPLFVDYTPSRYFLRNPERRADARPLRAADRAAGRHRVSRARQPRRQPRLSRSLLPRRRELDRHSGRQRADHLSWRCVSERAAGQRIHPRLADQPRAPHGAHQRWLGQARRQERLRPGRVSRLVGRTLPSRRASSMGPTATSMWSTCTAASCRPADCGAHT